MKAYHFMCFKIICCSINDDEHKKWSTWLDNYAQSNLEKKNNNIKTYILKFLGSTEELSSPSVPLQDTKRRRETPQFNQKKKLIDMSV